MKLNVSGISQDPRDGSSLTRWRSTRYLPYATGRLVEQQACVIMVSNAARLPLFALEWLALRSAVAVLRRGDLRDARTTVRRLSRIGAVVMRNHWSWAVRNLQLVFGPGLSRDSCERLALLAFEHHFASHMEALRVRHMAFHDYHRERLFDAFTRNRGVIMCAAHLGSWEPGLFVAAETGLPTAVVYRKADNPFVEREFASVREPYGTEWIPRQHVAAIIRALNGGKVLALMADINMRVGGVACEFLGLPAMCPPGPARLAIHCQSPVVPVVSVREDGGIIAFHFLPPIEPPAGGTGSDAVPAFLRKINAAFEPWIIEYAEQYNWLHPRWRSRPDGRLWSPAEPLESMWAERTAGFSVISERVRKLLEQESSGETFTPGRLVNNSRI